MFWRPASMPELAHLSASDRRRILRRAIPPRWWVFVALRCLAVGALAWIVTMMTFAWMQGGRVTAMGAATAGVAGGCLLVVAYRVQLGWLRKAMRDGIREASAGERTPVCLTCGYDLTGHTGDDCPECGGNVRS